MSVTISLLHATRGRPKKAVETMRLWHDRALNPQNIEHIFACESSDNTVPDLMDELENGRGFSSKVIIGNYGGSAPAWNAAYLSSSGALLVQVSDDFEPPDRWDELLLRRLEKAVSRRDPCGTPEWCLNWHDPRQTPLVVEVSEHYRKDRLMTMFICSRKYAEVEGHFLCPLYQSVFSDDEATFRARKNAALGRCVIVDARDVVFTHRHHYHDKSVPFDSTYAAQNSSEAYAKGQQLFAQRNPTAYGEDMKLWK